MRQTLRPDEIITPEGVAARAAVYVRTASALQTTAPDEEQTAVCLADASVRHLEVVQVYSDAGCSGRTMEGRPGWDELIQAAEQREFDVLLVSDANRICRDPCLFGVAHEALSKRNVSLISVSEGPLDLGDSICGLFEAYLRRDTSPARRKQAKQVRRHG